MLKLPIRGGTRPHLALFYFQWKLPPPPLTPFDLIAVYSHLCIPLLSKSKMAATVLVSKLARS